ncbi:aldo/keto reductase [candidate division KSB1 bacterium]|nr:aldo/keto reductase [candidate division KSB1 bacterium]
MKWQRRQFLKKGSQSLLALSAMPSFKWLALDTADETKKEQDPIEYRILGKTGMKITTVSMGAMRTREPSVIHHALDQGINYIDTARRYMDGYNEVVVGQVLKTRRKDTFVATKILPGKFSESEILDSLEASLKALQTDYVDVIQLHGMSNVEDIQNEEAMSTLAKIKQEGKARFVGFTTHSNQRELLLAAIPLKFYDTILVSYNFKSPPELGEAIQKAADSGIGIVAMKTQAGGYETKELGNLSPHQAALKWVLQNQGVHTTIPGMVTYAQIDENIQAMGSKMGWHDRKVLHRYGNAIDHKLCRMCGQCEGACPQGVSVLDVNRVLMYSEGYRDPDLASMTFHELSAKERGLACLSCDHCTVRCPHGLNIQARIQSVQQLMV